MTRSLWHRRRGERFAQLLDEADGGRRHRLRSPHDEDLTELVDLRNQLTATPPPETDPEFRAGLRAMLVATAEREGIGATAAPAPEPDSAPAAHPRTSVAGLLARGPRARTAVLAGVAAGAVAFTGMSTASTNAVPGDALYGVKRSTERAQLALASSDVGRAQLYLDFAQTRLAEAHALTDGLARVLEDMDRDTLAGVELLTTAAANRQDPAPLDPIDRFVADQRQALDTLGDQVDGPERERVETSLELLDRIERRALDLRRNFDLECPSATSVDALGPLPGSCVALTAPDPSRQTERPATQGPASQPDAGSDTEQPAATEPEAGEPDGASAGDRSDEPAATNPSPAATDPTDTPEQPEEQPDPAEDEDEDDAATEDDDGLLDSLNRVLGDLLGG